ncbi:MAG: hypothetical protein SVU32_05435, partial [Candidatus Nanohaloarchaea archaeon]|nr:hypothetical protein [Candidatus Nanohaloarchaea archaeon]
MTQDGQVQSQIVVGKQGKQADVVGAINVAASLGNSAVRTAERTAAAASGDGWTAAGGAATISTDNTEVYFQDAFDKAGLKTTLTSDDLDVLASGTVSNVDSEDYPYDQYLAVGSKTTSIGTSGGDLDDASILVQFGETPSTPLYTAQVT